MVHEDSIHHQAEVVHNRHQEQVSHESTRKFHEQVAQVFMTQTLDALLPPLSHTFGLTGILYDQWAEEGKNAPGV